MELATEADLATCYEYGLVIHALIEKVCVARTEEIEGRVVTMDEVREHGRMEVTELSGIAVYFWKNEPICQYEPAKMTMRGFKNASITKLTKLNVHIGP